MKRKDLTAAQSMRPEEIQKQILDVRKKIDDIEIMIKTKPTKNTRERKMMRRTIAQLQTIIHNGKI